MNTVKKILNDNLILFNKLNTEGEEIQIGNYNEEIKEIQEALDLLNSKCIIKYLWKIIDDIDTTGDIAKFDDKFYRKRVEKLQKKRWNTDITSDGYTLDLSKMKCDKLV